MKLSFVIVTKNVKKYLGACLESIGESIKDLETLNVESEVIVVDNASDDDSAAVAKAACSCIKVIRNKHDLGFAAAANKGVSASTGDLVFFVDPTVEVLPGSVRRILDYMETHNNCGIAGGTVLCQKGMVLSGARRFPSCISKIAAALGCTCGCKGKADQPVEVNWVPFTFAAVRRGLFNKLGQFDERFFAELADADLCRRAAKALNPVWKVAYIPQARVRILDKFAMKPEPENFNLYGSSVVRSRTRSEQLYFWKHYCAITSTFFGLFDVAAFGARYAFNLIPGLGSEKKRTYACTVVSETSKAMLDTQLGAQYPTTPWK